MEKGKKEEKITPGSGLREGAIKERKIFQTITFLVFSLLFLTIVFFNFFSKPDDLQVDRPLDLTQKEKLEGEVYLTLSPIEGEKTNIYKLDVETMELEEYFEDSPYNNYMAKFSSDQRKMVFVREYDDYMSQILLLDLESNEIKELTTKSEYRANNPVFSQDDTKITFWTYESKESPSGYGQSPSEHNIYVLSLDDLTTEVVAQGVFPLFFPKDSSLIYLGNEGLYKVNLENGEETLLADLSDLMLSFSEFADDSDTGFWGWFSIRFNYLPEKEMLVLTNSMNSRVYFAELTPVDSGLSYYKWFDDFHVNAPHWPNFSPEGDFIAVQTFEPGVTEFSQLSLFDTETAEVYKTVELTDYKVNSIWVTDWIRNK
jgi:hypothetical protein